MEHPSFRWAMVPMALAMASALMMAVSTTPTAQAADAVLQVDSELLRMSDAQRQKAVADMSVPTRVKIAGGKMRLADAITQLSADGNTTTLDSEVDPTREAELPPLTGTYWEAVVAICDAYELVPKPGVPRGGQPAHDERGLALQTGTLELRQRDPANPVILAADGPLLGEVEECEIKHTIGAKKETAAEIVMSLRLEPRFVADRVGDTGIKQLRIEDAQGRSLAVEPEAQNDGSDVPELLRVRARVGDDAGTIMVLGEARVSLVEPWRLSAPLRPGSSVAISCAGKNLTLHLVDAEHQGLSGGQGPMLELFFPRDALWADPRIRLSTAGKTLAHRGSGGSQTGAGRVVYNTYPALEDAAYDATVSGSARLSAAPLRLEVKLPIDLAKLGAKIAASASEIDLFKPSHVSWPAGKTSLKDALARLEVSGNQVLLQLGADERATRELPAFDGTFWQGVLAVCAAFDMAIMPPTAPPVGAQADGTDSPACLAAGPLSLGVRRMPAGAAGTTATTATHQACGALLVEIGNVNTTVSRSLLGGAHQAEVVCHLRLEPKAEAELVGSCSVSANSFGQDDHGRVVTIADSAPTAAKNPEQDRRMRGRVLGQLRARGGGSGGEGDDASPRYDLVFTAANLEQDATSLIVTGQVRIEVQRQVRAEATLSPGVTCNIPFGDGTLAATLYDTAAAEASGLRQPALGLSGQGNLEERSMSLIPPSGTPLTTNGHGSWSHHGRQEMLYLYPITEEGPYRLVINDLVHLADVRVPFSATIPLP